MEENHTIENLLIKSAVFEGLDQPDLEEIGSFTELAVYKAGERLMRKDKEADFLYVLIDGRISLSLFNIDGNAVPLFSLEEEGDTAAFASIQYPFVADTDIIAVTDARLLKIDAKKLRKKAFTDKRFGYQFFQRMNTAMCKQLYVYRNLIADFANKT